MIFMSFEDFKKKYREKLKSETSLSQISDEEIAKMFIALVVVEEYRNEGMEKQVREMRKKRIKSIEDSLRSRMGLDDGGDPS